MATNHKDEVRNPHVRYERRGMNVGMVLLVMFGLVIGGVIAHFSVVGLWVMFNKQSEQQDKAVKPELSWQSTTKEPKRLPPSPRLQPDPESDLHQMREAEDNVLNTYGWIDKNAGVVRIPVARSLDLLAQRGLPNWGTTPTQAGGAKTPPAKPAGSGTGK